MPILFSLLIMLPILSKSLVFVWFKTNQDFIAQNLCINKDNIEKPDCNGCCVLNEELKKIEAEGIPSSKDAKEGKEKIEYQWNYCDSKNALCFVPEPKSRIMDSFFILNLNDQFLANIEKPPCLL